MESKASLAAELVRAIHAHIDIVTTRLHRLGTEPGYVEGWGGVWGLEVNDGIPELEKLLWSGRNVLPSRLRENVENVYESTRMSEETWIEAAVMPRDYPCYLTREIDSRCSQREWGTDYLDRQEVLRERWGVTLQVLREVAAEVVTEEKPIGPEKIVDAVNAEMAEMIAKNPELAKTYHSSGWWAKKLPSKPSRSTVDRTPMMQQLIKKHGKTRKRRIKTAVTKVPLEEFRSAADERIEEDSVLNELVRRETISEKAKEELDRLVKQQKAEMNEKTYRPRRRKKNAH